MRISTINDEATVDDLVDRVHGAGAAKNPAVRDAFLEANPHLADFENLPTGTPVIVPDDRAAVPPPDERQRSAVAQAQEAIALTRTEFEAGVARESARVAEAVQLLNDPKTAEAMRKNRDMDNLRSEMLGRLAEQESEWISSREAMNTAFAGFEEVLKSAMTPPAPPLPPEPEPPPDKDTQPPTKRRRAVGKALKRAR